MDKNANLYTWDAQTHNMFAYSREAFQKAYDQYGIKADDYDEVLIMPARGTSGLANGPGNINRDPTDGDQTNTNQAAYVDHDGKTHYVSTVITAGNDMFSWGYRWINHEFGHTVGLPDLYLVQHDHRRHPRQPVLLGRRLEHHGQHRRPRQRLLGL